MLETREVSMVLQAAQVMQAALNFRPWVINNPPNVTNVLAFFNSFVAKQNELLWTVGKRRWQKSASIALAQIAEMT